MKNPPCSQKTRNGRPCRIGGDREFDGRPYCHLHDPRGKYQQQHSGSHLPASIKATPMLIRELGA